MKIGRKIIKALVTDIGVNPSPGFKNNVIEFMNEHGTEVAENILNIPRKTLYSWKSAKTAKAKSGKIKGQKHGRK